MGFDPIGLPKCLTNDYVYNIFSASSSRVSFSCHLCLHHPFSNRRLWKGHSYLVHGLRSADVTRLGSVRLTESESSHAEVDVSDKHSEEIAGSTFYEDVSDDASDDTLKFDSNVAAMPDSTVARISCCEETVETLQDVVDAVNSASR